MVPAVVYPVDESMLLWTEEQFGPVIPVAVYDDIEEVNYTIPIFVILLCFIVNYIISIFSI